MTPRTVPPPPGWEARPFPGESEFMTRHAPRIRAFARRVWNPYRVGKANDDVEQDIAIAVLAAARRHAWYYGELPTDPLATTIARRGSGRIARASCARYRRDAGGDTVRYNDDGSPRYLDQEVPGEYGRSPDEAIAASEFADVTAGLVYAIRRNLPPAAFAVLHLRYAEELEPSEIAALAGFGEANGLGGHRASKRISLAEDLAREFLEGIGITSFDDLTTTAIGDIDHDALDVG